MSSQAYPLDWPPGRPRTKVPGWSRFGVTPGKASSDLLFELQRLGATNIVVSTNIQLRKDGFPYAGQRNQPQDVGVAVYFDRNGQRHCIACDAWNKVHDNIRAIGLTVAAIRGMERWGATGVVDAALAGFHALPAGSDEDPYEVLGLRPECTWQEVQEAWREWARKHHPDLEGGDKEMFLRGQRAYEQIRPMR